MTPSQHKLKVMHLILNLEVGGGQQVVRTLVEYQASNICIPIVCTFRDGPLRKEIESVGIQVMLLPDRRYSILAFPWFIADMLRILRSLAALVNQNEIEVIQTHLLSTLAFLTLFLPRSRRARSIFWTFHSANFMLMPGQLTWSRGLLGPKRFAHKFIYRLAARWVSGYIAVSDQVKASMLQVIGPIQDRITVICNGVNLKCYGQPVDRSQVRDELGLPKSAFLLIMVGTLREPKGHRFMIEAMSMLAPRYPDLHLLCAGDGELRSALETQVRSANLGCRVHFLGTRQDIPRLLGASDLFVMPSLWEGLSMALLEAMASSLPVVSTQVAGTIQVMLQGETGLLVPPGDVPSLIQAVEIMLADPARARQMGLAARRRVETEFSAQKQAKEHLALYQRALSTRL